MADVLIVCVREDEPKAKALAEMFEAAGFTIGGAPGSDAALRSSGAGVIVWSQASIRSRPFLDAAQRVINAEKAVVASLIEPPPPSSVGDAATFDLSHWSGDPDEPELDPLFFAVDRMVNAARASVGAEPAQPIAPAFEPPPSLRPAPQRPAPRPVAAPPPAASPDLGAEAEHWRAIRDSRDPAVFLDYLARYGTAGAFAEVAELRLKQLTGGAGAEARARPAPAPLRAPPPRVEATPPPRREPPAPPPRRDPPPARLQPPPPPRRPAPPPERRYEEIEAREPPRGEGGALRAFVLIALLGGAALAGAIYFGGLPEQSAPAQSAEVVQPTPPLDGEPASSDERGAESAPLSEVASPSRQASARAAPQREAAREAPRAQASAPALEPEQPTPAPVTSWAAGGTPVPLIPRDTTASTGGPTALVPIGPSESQAPPQQAPAQTGSLPAATTQAAAPPVQAAPAGAVVWTQRPSGNRISELYPSRAQRDGVGGRVLLNCTVLNDLSVQCGVTSETPAGMGFGRAALSAASSYRARPTLSNGQSAIGANARIAVQFQPPARE